MINVFSYVEPCTSIGEVIEDNDKLGFLANICSPWPKGAWILVRIPFWLLLAKGSKIEWM